MQWCHTVLTFHLQIDKGLLVALSCARVTFVPAFVLNFDPFEEQGGISMRDVGIEQGGASTEVLVLESELIFVVVVAVNRDLLLVPVDDHSSGGSEAAGQDAVILYDTGDVCIW